MVIKSKESRVCTSHLKQYGGCEVITTLSMVDLISLVNFVYLPWPLTNVGRDKGGYHHLGCGFEPHRMH